MRWTEGPSAPVTEHLRATGRVWSATQREATGTCTLGVPTFDFISIGAFVRFHIRREREETERFDTERHTYETNLVCVP